MIGYYVEGDRDRCQRVTAPSKKEETLQTKEAGIFFKCGKYGRNCCTFHTMGNKDSWVYRNIFEW